MYTTACEHCRKSRLKCVRPSRGYVVDEVCERCQATGRICETRKRKVGRQAGVTNKKTRASLSQQREDGDIPNPLHFLASTAERRSTRTSPVPTVVPPVSLDPRRILRQHSEWTRKMAFENDEVLFGRLQSWISRDVDAVYPESDEASVFTGRVDMSRPDAAPEHDAIALQIVSLSEAERIYSLFIEHITNGSMTFDPQIHTLSFIRSRSSFLLASILYVATSFKAICSDQALHIALSALVTKLTAHVKVNCLKSLEIVQAMMTLATYTEVTSSLAHDRSWMYTSQAITLAIELRLDLPVPYCVQSDPSYSSSNHEIMVRNAHRTLLLLFIHDRNMAMVAGRYPILPETSLFAPSNLATWGKHPLATRFDAPMCASVSLRQIITTFQLRLASAWSCDFDVAIKPIQQSLAAWRTKWFAETQSTKEYDVIARFSQFVLALTILRKASASAQKAEAAEACDSMAFEVCCATIGLYRTWQGILNAATYDTSMVAFCAIHIIHSITRASSGSTLSDWDLYRLAVIQELVAQLRSQAELRHSGPEENDMPVPDAMARQLGRRLRLLLNKTPVAQPVSNPTVAPSMLIPNDPVAFMMPDDAMPFISDWNLDSLFKDFTYQDAFSPG